MPQMPFEIFVVFFSLKSCISGSISFHSPMEVSMLTQHGPTPDLGSGTLLVPQMPFEVFGVFFSLKSRVSGSSSPFIPPWKSPCFQGTSRTPACPGAEQLRTSLSKSLPEVSALQKYCCILRTKLTPVPFPLFPPNLCCLKEAPSDSFQYEEKQNLKNNCWLWSQCREAARSSSEGSADSSAVPWYSQRCTHCPSQQHC